MTPVIDLEDDKTTPGQVLNIGYVTLRGAVGARWDIAVIENDGFVATFRGFFKGDGQQAKDLAAFRDIADKMLVIIRSVGERLLEGDFTAGDIQVPQVVDGDLFADIGNDFCLCRGGCMRAGRWYCLCWRVGLAGN